MSVGFPADKGAIDARSGSLATQIRDLFTQISQFQSFLGTQTDAQLAALGYSGNTTTAGTDIYTLRSAFTQLNQLRAVATGGATLPAVNNFLFFSDQLTGVN